MKHGLITENPRGSLTKWPGKGVRADLIRWIMIRRLRTDIAAIKSRASISDLTDQGQRARGGGGAARRSSALRRRAAGEGKLGAAGLGLGPGLAEEDQR